MIFLTAIVKVCNISCFDFNLSPESCLAICHVRNGCS